MTSQKNHPVSSLLSTIHLTWETFIATSKVGKREIFLSRGRLHPSLTLAQVADMPLAIPADTIASMAPCLAASANTLVSELRRLFLVESMVDTIKFGLSLWLLTYLGAWFNALTLVIVAWVAAFALPKLYLNNQAAVDDVVAKVMAQVEEVKAKVVALIPGGMKAAEKQE